MPTFAIIVGQEGVAYVRMPNGEWIRGFPGMSLWQDVPPNPNVNDPEKVTGKHAVDEKFAEELEAELARLRRKQERSS